MSEGTLGLRQTAARWLAKGRPTVLVAVVQARGSVPRKTGTRMLVSAERCSGTIGGGHLELQAIARARAMLLVVAAGGSPLPQEVHYPLGPALGQCCGGAVTLGFLILDSSELAAWPAEPARFHLQLYGAGHVGKAIASLLAGLPVTVDWIDEREHEFPDTLGSGTEHGPDWPPHIQRLAVDTVEAEVALAPAGAFYLVLTHRHDLDERITEAILRRGDFAYLGLIGSRTKQQRFLHRFEERGIPAETLARMTCPIGLPGLSGKAPEVIAVSVVAQLLQRSSAGNTPRG